MASTWDQDADAAYIDLRGGNEELALRQMVALTEPESYEVILDVAPSGKFLGVEVLGASEALDPAFLETLMRIDEPPKTWAEWEAGEPGIES